MSQESDLSTPRAQLSSAQQALLHKWLRGECAAQTIPRRSGQDLIPLSFAQERLWFLNQLEPESGAYNIPAALRLVGKLDHAALEQGMNEIVRRHEGLRTTFAVSGGKPYQVISAMPAVILPVVDLRHHSANEQEQTAQQLIEEESCRPFDLVRGPLIRGRLLWMAEDLHVLLLAMHHIVSDGWSMSVFVRELAALYQAFVQGSPSPLPDLSIQYADYAIWQRAWLQGQVLEQQLAYWRKQLANVPVLMVPTDYPRPTIQSYRGTQRKWTLSSSLTESLRTFSREMGVTLFMTLLAAFQTLLYRYTTQVDIAVGTPIANRNRHEIENLIGFFVNTLVLRTNLAGEPTFREVVERVRNVTLEAYAHQDLTFEQVVKELHPERDLSHSPLFQVMFALQNMPVEELEGMAVSNLTLQPLQFEGRTSMFDLTFMLWEKPTGLVGHVEYCTDLYQAATIERLLRNFETLLEGIVADPNRRISKLPLLDKSEQEQLVIDWNATQTAYPAEQGLHELFEVQAQRTPDAVAVVFEEDQLTYRELNARANQLAFTLRMRGVGPDVLVGICVERSLEMIVGLLGVLKAGGAYVPLDPDYPVERLALMLADSGIRILLTQARLVERLPAHEAQVVCLDADSIVWDQTPHTNLPKIAHPDNLAYMIYTSGSTGRPKGVQIPMRAAVNFMTVIAKQLELTSQDRWLAVTTLSFDIAALELFLPLILGARVVLVSRATVSDGQRLLNQLVASGATIMQATPATWRLLLDAGWSDRLPLKALCGGEALSPQLVARLRDRVTKLWNLYGPTETTIWSMLWCVDWTAHEVSIGRPLGNTQIYLLDAQFQPVPIGVAGELYIGGAGLARGYGGRPDLTAERFVPNPFRGQGSGIGDQESVLTSDPRPLTPRLYRTGDLARYRSDGNIEFLGRIDHQVKVRGFRIELGEIETQLARHQDVREVVVVARQLEDLDSKALVAYIVTRSGETLAVDELRGFLRTTLPDYMIPTTFMFLETLPLTPSGKVNRQMLPAPDGSRPELQRAYVAPQTELEQTLAAIWQEALHIDKIGLHDNFFDLGGHSLLLSQVQGRLQATLQREISMIDLFTYPNLRSLADYLSQGFDVLSSVQRPDRSQQQEIMLRQKQRWMAQRTQREALAPEGICEMENAIND